jgi:alkylhydroperoxidase family enzyme
LDRFDKSETLASVLSPSAIEMAELRRRYGDLLELVRRLIGVVPNCDPLLEIWPTAFRTYNLLVPNFLNLPALLFGGGAPKEIVGLAMYVSSRAAGCAYCAAHTCSFALRRGTAAEKITAAYGVAYDQAYHSAAEQAVIAAAEGLARVPSTFSAADRDRLELYFTSAHAEWLGLAVAMMGFLNKFMDAAGVPLEEQTMGEVAPVIGASGWAPGKHGRGDVPEGTPPRADSIWTTLGVLRYAPRAVMRDRQWTTGVPAHWPAVGAYLRETGHDFPILGRLQHARPRRALATMLSDNLTARHSSVGLQVKTLAGLVYAIVVQDGELAEECGRLAENSGVPQTSLRAVADFASMPSLFGTDSDLDASELELRSDKRIDEAWCDALLVARVGAKLPPEALVELLTWISIQQLLHRLGAYFVRT